MEPEKVIEECPETVPDRQPMPDTDLDIEVLELEEDPYSDDVKPKNWWWNI